MQDSWFNNMKSLAAILAAGIVIIIFSLFHLHSFLESTGEPIIPI